MAVTPSFAHAFVQRLDPAELATLQNLAARPAALPPTDWTRWRCGTTLLGLLSAATAARLQRSLADCHWDHGELIWDSAQWSTQRRSDALQSLLLDWKEQGWVTGWRNERFSFWADSTATPDPTRPALFSVERAGFRTLGMMSHAVHINGFVRDGRLWCGRRSPDKATDPGLWDNVTAGGLPSTESIAQCAVRELQEEAGITGIMAEQLHAAGAVRTTRVVPQGLHDETLWVFNLEMSDAMLPVNQDGEVAEFACLDPQTLLRRVCAEQFTVDALWALLQGLNLPGRP